MSMKKTNVKSYSFREEFLKTIKRRKIETVGMLLFFLIVTFDFIAYTKSLYTIFTLSAGLLYAIFYFVQSLLLNTRLRLALKTMSENPDFKTFTEELRKLTPEQLKMFEQIQRNNMEKAEKEGLEVKSILEE